MAENIFITGMGVVCPSGIGIEEFKKNLFNGHCAISDIEKIDTSLLKVKRAGEVKDFNPKDYLPVKLALDLEPYQQYAYVAAEEAVKMSGISSFGTRVGITMGTALNGIGVVSSTQDALTGAGKGAGPKFLVKAMGNIAAAQFSINHGIQGPSMSVSTACSSAGDAITVAAMMIKAGMADAMVVMAGEAAICATLVQSLTKTGALSKEGQSKPFDISRDGFVMGEGGGALVLESEKFMKERGGKPLARLLGCANNTDAFNPVSPNPDGLVAAECMRLALEDAGILPDDVDYINAHGTSTKMGDLAECRAIRKTFDGRPVPVSSTKGMTGHMMGAGGVVELIACILAINEGQMPVNVGCAEQDPECDINLVTEKNRKGDIRVALSNSMGFGGQNSSIIVGKV